MRRRLSAGWPCWPAPESALGYKGRLNRRGICPRSRKIRDGARSRRPPRQCSRHSCQAPRIRPLHQWSRFRQPLCGRTGTPLAARPSVRPGPWLCPLPQRSRYSPVWRTSDSPETSGAQVPSLQTVPSSGGSSLCKERSGCLPLRAGCGWPPCPYRSLRRARRTPHKGFLPVGTGPVRRHPRCFPHGPPGKPRQSGLLRSARPGGCAAVRRLSGRAKGPRAWHGRSAATGRAGSVRCPRYTPASARLWWCQASPHHISRAGCFAEPKLRTSARLRIHWKLSRTVRLPLSFSNSNRTSLKSQIYNRK